MGAQFVADVVPFEMMKLRMLTAATLSWRTSVTSAAMKPLPHHD